MHSTFLLQALAEAELGKGFCAPNPAVGAIVVKNGKVIGKGYHHAAGTPHAEIHALQAAGREANGATLYITLEPCCHEGRTPPCTTAIIAANLAKVYFAYYDPNPIVQGKGQAALTQAGISCKPIAIPEIQHFYRSYQHWTQFKMPWITAKLAMSLDAKVAHSDGTPAKITGAKLATFTHQQRLKADALLSTINTVLQDDPALNVRLDKNALAKKIYLLDSQLQFPLSAKLYNTAQSLTIFHEPQAPKQRIEILQTAGIRCIPVETTSHGLNLQTICKIIGQDGIHDLWVEAGGRAFQSFITEKLANEAYLYIAPKMLGPDAISAFNQPILLTKLYSNILWRSVENELIGHLSN